MPAQKYTALRLWIILILVFSLSLVAACNSDDAASTGPQKLSTWLLVRAPEGPLPAGLPVDVKSRSVDSEHNISHVELYAVELPTGEKNVLIRSDAAPFKQTSFTASQLFVPVQPGYYVIKVVGYNTIGDSTESEYISFQVK